MFCYHHRDDLSKDELTDEDWSYLDQIVTALKPFREATKRLEGHAHQGHHGAVWEVLPLIEALLPIYEAGRQNETQKRQGTTATALEVAYQNAWEKLTKYYKRSDETYQIYAAAVLLYPSFRRHYFQARWEQKWMRPMIAGVKKHWSQCYQALDAREDDSINKGEAPLKQARTELDFLDRYLATAIPATTTQNDFDAYIAAPAIELGDADAVFPWLRKSTAIPTSLRQQCLDLLCIPAMSAEVERVFSVTKRTITADRNRLHYDTIEQLELLKYWWAHDLIVPMG